jgi:DNA-directed RNA polymerase specialized sigma24 family protein
MQTLVGDFGVPEGPTDPALQLQVAGSIDDQLQEFAKTEAARRLAILEADKELVNRLMWRQYQGTEWARFTEALAQYGFQVTRAWIKNGMIFVRCSEKGFGGLKQLDRTADDASEIAGETVAQAIVAFRDNVLVPGRWDPTKGASLRTFFVGQCMLQFPNVYRRWARERDEPSVDRELLARELANSRNSPAPGHVRAFLGQFLERLTPESPEMIEALIEMGYEQLEIAAMLHTTRGAIQSKLYRYRKQRSQ